MYAAFCHGFDETVCNYIGFVLSVQGQQPSIALPTSSVWLL